MNAPDSNRFFIAMLLYGAFAASAYFTLSGEVRIFILIFFAALALKTWLSQQKQKLESPQESGSGQEAEGPQHPPES